MFNLFVTPVCTGFPFSLATMLLKGFQPTELKILGYVTLGKTTCPIQIVTFDFSFTLKTWSPLLLDLWFSKLPAPSNTGFTFPDPLNEFLASLRAATDWSDFYSVVADTKTACNRCGVNFVLFWWLMHFFLKRNLVLVTPGSYMVKNLKAWLCLVVLILILNLPHFALLFL